MNVSHNINLILVLILSTKKWWGLFCSGSVIGTFVAHLMATQGARRVPELEVKSKGLLTIIPMVLFHSLQLE